MKFDINPELIARTLQGLDEMLTWYELKISSLEPPTKEDDKQDIVRKLIEVGLVARYSEVLVASHNLILALAHNDGVINLEKETDQ